MPHGPSKFGFRVAMLEEAKELFAGFLGEGFIRLIPGDWVVKAAEKLPESLLTDNDTRLRWAAGIGLVLDGLVGLGTAQRNALQNFLVQTAEEVGKRSSELDLYGSTKDRKVIRESMEKNKSTLEPLRAKKDAPAAKPVQFDYFAAKAAIKDKRLRKLLLAVEAKWAHGDLPSYERFLDKDAYRVQTSPDELTEIAESSEQSLSYGVQRLQGLVSGRRGLGGIKGGLNALAEDLFGDLVKDGGIDQKAEKFSADVRALTASIPIKKFK